MIQITRQRAADERVFMSLRLSGVRHQLTRNLVLLTCNGVGLKGIESMTNLSDVELDPVSGGVMDNPWSDATNQRIAAENNGTGFGGSLGDVIPGLVVKGSGPNTPGHPFDWNP